MSRSMREAAAAIESIFVAAPGRVNIVINPAPPIDPRDSAENWEELGALSADDDCDRVRAKPPTHGTGLSWPARKLGYVCVRPRPVGRMRWCSPCSGSARLCGDVAQRAALRAATK